jgi:hypothetical protein
MSLRPIKKTFVRNRAAHDPTVTNKHAAAIITEIESTAADTIQLSFLSRVMTSKLPDFAAGADGEETVEEVMRISDTVLELTFSGDVAGTDLIVSDGDLGIRTVSGGFVPAGTYAIPTFP